MFSIRLLLVALWCGLAKPQTPLPNVEHVVRWALQKTGAPSASVAIAQNGALTYDQAFGEARLSPPTPAQPAMRYAVGSVSKQFTAAAILMLAQEGKLTLDDSVSRFFPKLTRAREVTVRMLLSHTSGYSDYWPEDYVMTSMLLPTSPGEIIGKWATRSLDFDPGTKWQYSNTNYVIAGQIVEKLAGEPLFAFLKRRIFDPLHMTTVYNVDEQALPASDAAGYYRHALGPLRPAPKEGRGWLSAAGELSMTAADLVAWDVSLINRSILKPASYEAMFKEVKLKDGSGTHYGLGVDVHTNNGQVFIEHSGEVSGFTAQNTVIPGSKAAIVVLVNEDAIGTAAMIQTALAPALTGNSPAEERARRILNGLRNENLDRSELTGFCNSYFTAEAIHDFAAGLKPLGEPLFLIERSEAKRGGMTFRSFLIQYRDRALTLTTYEMPDGKLEQFLITPAQS